MNYCFIDFNNLHLGIKQLGWRIDYRRLYKFLRDSYLADKVFGYLGYLKEYEKLYRELESFGYILVFKQTLVVKENSKIKANVDVDLTVDAIRKSKEYAYGVFISGDGDFVPLYDYLLEIGKNINILVPDIHCYSKFLRKYGNRVLGMNNLQNKISKKSGSFVL
jgi:uncharacterized LabA/DUF88 family protein